ncbi:hypothetical protein FBU30_009654 [Linnemannia zychae]|nr:hypothetical protein FBU30_009654 [Linnemannia zychae]
MINRSNQPLPIAYSTRLREQKNNCIEVEKAQAHISANDASSPRKRKCTNKNDHILPDNIEVIEKERKIEEDGDDDDAFAGDDFSDAGENSDDEVDDSDESQQRFIAPEVLEASQSLERSTVGSTDTDNPNWDTLNIDPYYICVYWEFCDQRYRDGKRGLIIPGIGEPDEQDEEKDPGDKHPYEVTHKKGLAFFKDFLFKKPTIKKLYLHKDYSYPFATYHDISEKDIKAAISLMNYLNFRMAKIATRSSKSALFY